MIRELISDLRDHFEHIPQRTNIEQAMLDRLNSGYFPITSLHRNDLASKGFDIQNVSDRTMEHLARLMADDYCEQLFWHSLNIIASQRFNIPKFPECPSCGDEGVVFDPETKTYRCLYCGQEWSDAYVLVEEPNETDEIDDLGYPSCEARGSNARYITEYDYIRIFGKKPEPNSYYEPVCWPESQKYMPEEDNDGDSIDALNELINDEKGLEDFGPSAYWVPRCNLK